ncbi:3-keto-5-aminohexanoate cleavage protein [Agrococcus sp. SGAir0287]|uniref:3-keto-5-aminohexanoate cleavage protein n=1 Tax=Agrococcus sp. SGAir0287 TaxID=2070347 RepID=UPI0010CD2B7C|nr:3-keto-5-aminohexanoate cleavage protein [Agrococcus sp. SGAir0287]QCR18447.1 hypothetical protein C1N71_02425 [Agrococcus sp. SGAir0287]
MLIKAAVNGGRTTAEHAPVPVTPEAIARESVEAIAAGADVVHAHARTPDGGQTIAPDDVRALVEAVRALDPALVLGTTTGLWTCSGHLERMRLVEAWPEDALPSFASVAFCEEGAAEAARLVRDRGMVLESAVWSLADVPALLAADTLHDNVRILIEPEDEEPDVAVAHARAMAAMIREAVPDVPLLYHGYDQTSWPVVRAAIEDGVQIRIGFEDDTTMPDGSPAASNAAMIRAAIDSLVGVGSIMEP